MNTLIKALLGIGALVSALSACGEGSPVDASRAAVTGSNQGTFGSADEVTDLGALALNEQRFWDGPLVEKGGLSSGGVSPAGGNLPSGSDLGSLRCAPAGAPQDPPLVPCFRYVLSVAPGGTTLRIGLDHPDLRDVFGAELRDPSGTLVAQETGDALTELGTPLLGGLYSFELIVSDPAPGDWALVVIANDVKESQFRLRAKLASDSASSGGRVPLLPDLRPGAPFQLGFGEGDAGCDGEQRHADTVRCLRFSQGPQNIGAGPLDLVVHDGDVGTLGTDANGDPTLFLNQYQRIHYADGTYEEAQAGTAEFHIRHAHYHHSETGNYLLYRADPQSRTMELTGDGPKQGFCMGDYAIAQWDDFSAEQHRAPVQYFNRRGCLVPTPGGNQTGLSVGWADIYPHFLEGQYVEFGPDDGDGYYVLQMQTNPPHSETETHGSVTESDYGNNFAYAYFRVCGNQLDVIERGFGQGPFDKNKVVVEDGRPPAIDSPKRYPPIRPDHCK